MKSFSEYRKQLLEEVDDNKKRKETYQKLEKLCNEVISVKYAFIDAYGNPNISLERGRVRITYNKRWGWNIDGGVTDTDMSMDWDNFKKYVAKLTKLIKELKKFDISMLPIRES